MTRIAMPHPLPAALALLLAAGTAGAAQFQITGPANSDAFGFRIAVLPNGNIVVADPFFDEPAEDAGAVYLYSPDGALISRVTGATAGDNVGYSGIRVLRSGHFVIDSPSWDKGSVLDAGAITFGNAQTGVSGVVSAANSLVGAANYDYLSAGLVDREDGIVFLVMPSWNRNTGAIMRADADAGFAGEISAANALVGGGAFDRVGDGGLVAVAGGNYVAAHRFWWNGNVEAAGAVTWIDAAAPLAGVVSAANSLVGTRFMDQVGEFVRALPNGNYLVGSPRWDDVAATNAGALTWGPGASGIAGVVSAANSLVGASANDFVGGVTTFEGTSDYVAVTSSFDIAGVPNAGALTPADGSVGLTGTLSAAASLVGTRSDDLSGARVHRLSNGHFVLAARAWDNGATADVGAVMWLESLADVTGTIDVSRALVGSTAGDFVGNEVFALPGGNYVISSPEWDAAGAAGAGAVTWAPGSAPTIGVVSPTNSLIGQTANDRVGAAIVVLGNGNFVVRSPDWDGLGAVNAGACTWASGGAPIVGAVSALNSVVGSSTDDGIGSYALKIGDANYLCVFPKWDDAGVVDAGAVAWANGDTGRIGSLSSSAALVGASDGDANGLVPHALANGNVALAWPQWGATNAGAVTLIPRDAGVTGTVGPANALVGSSAGDAVGSVVQPLANGHFVVGSPDWDRGALADAGAMTWMDGELGRTGALSAATSLVGAAAGDRVGAAVTAYADGNFVAATFSWSTPDQIAHTPAFGTAPAIGEVGAQNSVISVAPASDAPVYDAARGRILVGDEQANVVHVFALEPALFDDGFE